MSRSQRVDVSSAADSQVGYIMASSAEGINDHQPDMGPDRLPIGCGPNRHVGYHDRWGRTVHFGACLIGHPSTLQDEPLGRGRNRSLISASIVCVTRTVFFVASIATTASLIFFTLSAGWVLLVAIAAVAFFVFSMFPVSLAMGSELSGVERTGIGVGIIFGISGLSGAAVQPAVGAIADRSSLHTGLSVLIVGSVLAAVLSLKLPGKLAEEADDAGSVDDAGSADDASGSDDASADQAEVQASS